MNDRPLRKLMAENVAPRAGRRGWHGGPTVVGALRGVTAKQALWHPARGRHSIWELALHIAYWHHIISQRLLGTKRVPFPRSPANFPAVPDHADERAWRLDRAVIRAAHLEVTATILGIPPAAYGRRPEGIRRWTNGEMILGAAMHEAYHTGQIQLLKRLVVGA